MCKSILRLLLAAYMAFAAMPLDAQNLRERLFDPVEHTAGSSMSYRYEPQTAAPVPEGYAPFYISHFGRHGSRYHTTENIYRKFRDIFAAAAEADALTPFGREVKARIDAVFAQCDGHAGELSEVGRNEHREIARRMYAAYPEVFAASAKGRPACVFSRSTAVERVVESMRSFDAALMECDSDLEIEEAPAGKYNGYLNHYNKEYKEYYRNGGWRAVYDAKRSEWVRPERLMESLFSDGEYVRRNIKSRRSFMTELFAVASILQDTTPDVSLYDVFTDDEIYSLWRLQNLNQYLRKGPSAMAGELAASIAKPLLRDFVECADRAVAGTGGVAADLRFGHGEGLMPLAALMNLSGASTAESDPEKVEEAWNDYMVTPMAGNIQWIFYRNAKGRVLVKFLLNEREATIPLESATAPYYDWKAVRRYYAKIAAE
ncbi:MAG: histidine phosphatase family protein [Alistipes sp.]|nr:histidine phosphatase family protein [Alistipes sp.]